MRKPFLVFIFTVLALGLSAQSISSFITDYQRVIKSNEARIRNEMRISDPLFFTMVDTVAGYCTDSKFSPALQMLNLQGLARFMTKLNDKDQIRSGMTENLLLFYMSVMDWRKEGPYYDNLNSYSSFAMKCAAFFAEDSTGMRFIATRGEEYPDEILTYADQLTDLRKYRPVIETSITKDPDFAKRYFYSDNNVSKVASTSNRKDVTGVYDLFQNYGTKSKGYILYDAVRNNQITPEDADSISLDQRGMIEQLVNTLEKEKPLGIKSVLREMDYRASEWIRQTSRWAPPAVSTQFNKFSADQKLTILVLGYRECKPQLLDQYLDLLEQSDLGSVSPLLLDNLSDGNLPAFLHFLYKQDRLPVLLSYFNDVNKEKLSQMLASDENENGQPLSLESLTQNKGRPIDPKDASIKSSEINDKYEPVSIGEDDNRVDPAPPPSKSETYINDMSTEQIHIPLSDSSRAILGLKRNIYMALQDISSFIHKSYAKDLLLYAAGIEPDEVLKKVDMYKGKFWCKEVLEAATLNAPISAKRYFNNATHPVTVILGYSKDTVIKKFLTLSKEAKYESKPFLLFDEMVCNSLSLNDASSICKDNYALFRELMGIVSKKKYIGRYNVEREMNYYALRYIRSINDKIDQPERERFASVDALSCDELYYMMVYGREEVFDGTFAGLFSRFQSKCSAAGYWNAKKFTRLPHYRSFIAMCAAYNRLDKFLSLFSPADQRVILTTFASSLDKEREELSDASTVAETIANTSNPTVLQLIQTTIRESYMHLDSIRDYNGMAIYGILSALNKDKAVYDRKWFAAMAKKYKVGTLTTLSNASLTNGNVFVERMYFYDDADGRDSYRNFVATFSASPDWKVDQYFSYARIRSVNGKKVEIYANKPELEESGDREISQIIKDNGYVIGGIMHRGHSFHTEATLARVPASARFVFVGSCGGFYKINIALQRAPDAQVISTRQVGVKQINDPIIFGFNEYVRQGKDVNWKVFWDEMHTKLGSNSLFNDYVPPHKNLESLFVRAYYQIMRNE
jgi:hypothetical protein